MRRRTLQLVSLALVFAGLELSTSGVGFTLARLRAGAAAMSLGVEFHTSAFRFASGVGALTLGVTLWALVFWSGRVAREVGRVGAACPDCGSATERVKRKARHRWLAVLIGQRVTRRKCTACGWVGLSLKY